MQRPDAVLSVVWYKIRPSHFGGQKGIAIFSEYLGQKLPLAMICSANNDFKGIESYSPDPRLPVSKSQFLDPRAWKQIERGLFDNGAKTLLLEHCYYGLTGIWLQRKHCCRLVVHSHNIEYQRFREQGKWWWPLLKWIEKTTHRHADLTLFKTREDLEHGVRTFRLDPSKCMVVPYGIERKGLPTADERADAAQRIREQLGIPAHKKILLFNGTLDYEPNAVALESIVKDLLPLLGNGYHVIACGRIIAPEYKHLLTLSSPHYTYAGYVHLIEDFFMGADLFINPVHLGGGVKTKVVEALSYGLPVVSYRSGAAGVDRTVTGNMLQVVDDRDIKAFALAIRNTNYQETLPANFFSAYHWDNITSTVAERILQLAAE